MPAAKTSTKSSKKKQVKFVIDCWQPVEDAVLDVSNFEKFLRDAIKIDGKTGNLGETITITSEKTKIVISAAEQAFAKRYLKYLTKKYLKKQQLRDYLHVVATNKSTYEMKYFNINNDDAEEA
ncbi:ribosomal protein L22e [Pelagophyceae sp. CCMP2097]|nr:ribosomal protein L22e [Pelagophyceae sp. CCMP2097]|mmetsp:Transcript_11728/g.40514  ORF Transcript_11728/g.40514 Transcript_11728/m.40514 type:complete len:123 (+) Transcript_11728:253-621(+)